MFYIKSTEFPCMSLSNLIFYLSDYRGTRWNVLYDKAIKFKTKEEAEKILNSMLKQKNVSYEITEVN